MSGWGPTVWACSKAAPASGAATERCVRGWRFVRKMVSGDHLGSSDSAAGIDGLRRGPLRDPIDVSPLVGDGVHVPDFRSAIPASRLSACTRLDACLVQASAGAHVASSSARVHCSSERAPSARSSRSIRTVVPLVNEPERSFRETLEPHPVTVRRRGADVEEGAPRHDPMRTIIRECTSEQVCRRREMPQPQPEIADVGSNGRSLRMLCRIESDRPCRPGPWRPEATPDPCGERAGCGGPPRPANGAPS